MSYCIYLRKSRADLELEAMGEMETLARHQNILIDLAKRNHLTITKIYKEIVSGETIEARPEVQEMLNEVEDGKWDGVLVMEVERLARGDTIDQGIVARAFKRGKAKIVTPNKTYDPDNEFDEEYFEFGLFMSRREYKTINRRIQRGRIAAVQEGKFISSVPPYGYDKVKIVNGSGYTLKPNNESDVVKKIFSLYLSGIGMQRICDQLDQLCIKPRYRNTWSKSTISDILTNPVYTGKIRWKYRPYEKTGGNYVSRHKNNDCILVNGLHPAIISEEDFEKAQQIMKNHYRAPVKSNLNLKNSLSGLGYCKKCGTMLTRLGASSKNKVDKIICPNKNCDTVSAPLDMVEKTIVRELQDWLHDYIVRGKQEGVLPDTKILEKSLSKLKSNLSKIEKQISKTYDLLEQGVYTTEVFQSRHKVLEENKSDLLQKINNISGKLNDNRLMTLEKLEQTQHILDAYFLLETPEEKNSLLKSILDRFEYQKDERNTKGNLYNNNFTVDIFPSLPQI